MLLNPCSLGYLIDRMWDDLNLVKVYTKKRGAHPDLDDPICMRKGSTIEVLAERSVVHHMLTYHLGRLQRGPSVVGHKLSLCSSMVNIFSFRHHYERLMNHFQGKERSAARSFGLTGTLPGEVVKICAARTKGWAWPPRA